MGVGKTTIGKFLAEELNYRFYDTDREIESRTGADIPWIFDVEGEEGFRRREGKVLDHLSQLKNVVLATGGGIILKEDNRLILTERGTVVYLTATIDKLVERTSKDKKRPLLQVKNPRRVLEETLLFREPLYREVADLEVSTDKKSSRIVAKEISLALKK